MTTPNPYSALKARDWRAGYEDAQNGEPMKVSPLETRAPFAKRYAEGYAAGHADYLAAVDRVERATRPPAGKGGRHFPDPPTT